MFNNGVLLFSSDGQLAMAEACCCGLDPCCGLCPWLYDYWFAGGQLKITFTEGPLTGYIILQTTGTSQENSCLEWFVLDDSNLVDCDSLYNGDPYFWCESTGASDVPFKLSMTMGNGGCEVISIGVDPEFSECTLPVGADPYGTITVRYRWAMGELFPGGCDGPCGGLPQDIVVEVTLYP